jgi:polysaccharide export outer membrane protein
MNCLYLENKYFPIVYLSLILLFSSCGSTKNVPYFKDLGFSQDTVFKNTSKFIEPLIQPDDLISISIFTIDPATSMVVNQVGSQAISSTSGVQSSVLGATQATSGFLVDKNGEIDLSIVGIVKIAGLTTYEAKKN